MADSDFDITITKDAVDVRHTPSISSPRDRLYGLVFTISMVVLVACAVLFLPGKHGRPSMWHNLAAAPVGSASFLAPITGLALFVGLLGWQGVRYGRAAWPSDETFHCDRDKITISRVPWLSFSNSAPRTYTFPLGQVTAIRYAVIASAKGQAFWGLRFRAPGRKWTLPGLEVPDAIRIMTGLKALGADVPADPKLEKRLKEWHETQFGDTTWMDRSWMDSDKQ